MSKNQDLGELINGIKSLGTNQLNAPAYTSATSFTGTIAGYLGFDSSGNILTALGSSQWITSGTAIYYTTGFVGIGNNSPAAALDVIGANIYLGATNKIVLAYDLGTSANSPSPELAFYGQSFQANTSVFGPSIQGINVQTFGRKDLVFYQHSATDYVTKYEAMRLTYDGKLGIGINNPQNKLHVGSVGGGGSWMSAVFTDGIGVAPASSKSAVYLYSNGTSLWGLNAYDYTAGAYKDVTIGWDGTANVNLAINGGFVGVGKTNPSYKLDVNGDVNISGTFRVNGTPIGTGGGGVSGSGSTNYIAKWSGSTALTNSQIYDNGSSIGLRTASPYYVIDYALTGSLRLGYFIGSIDGTDNASGIVAHNGNGITQTVPFGFSGSKFAWYIGTNEAMRIDTNRNLLINTTGGVTGAGALQVNGDVNVTGTFRVNGVQYSTGGGGGGITGGGTADYIPKFTGSTSIGNSALWDNGNFSVHLGMTSFSGTGGDPQRYIAIYGPDSSGIIFKGDINDSQATSFIKRTNGVGNLTLYDTREVYLQASSSNYFKMNGSGIGINVQPFGTPYVLTLPNNSLQVAVAFSWLTYSDGRVKKEIKEIEYGINEVMKMKPVQYKHYSSEFVNNTLNIGDQYTNEIGFVAQDIHEIIKEAVNRGSETELWSLDKSKLIPVLVKAVQELKAELDELKQNNA